MSKARVKELGAIPLEDEVEMKQTKSIDNL
jgi:hypothetical protein